MKNSFKKYRIKYLLNECEKKLVMEIDTVFAYPKKTFVKCQFIAEKYVQLKLENNLGSL